MRTALGWRRAVMVPAPEELRMLAPSRTGRIVKEIENLLRWAFRIAAMGPAGLPGQLGSQLGTIAVDETAEASRRPVTASADIDRAGQILDSVLLVQDAFARRVVLGRAASEDWRRLATMDPQGRSIRWLRSLYAEALGELYPVLRKFL